jgi:hypothetical protein
MVYNIYWVYPEIEKIVGYKKTYSLMIKDCETISRVMDKWYDFMNSQNRDTENCIITKIINTTVI